MDRQTHRWTDRYTARQMDTQIDRQDRQLDGHTDRHTDRQTDKWSDTDRYKDRKTHPPFKSIIFGITFNNSYYLSFSTRFLVDILTKDRQTESHFFTYN